MTTKFEGGGGGDTAYVAGPLKKNLFLQLPFIHARRAHHHLYYHLICVLGHKQCLVHHYFDRDPDPGSNNYFGTGFTLYTVCPRNVGPFHIVI